MAVPASRIRACNDAPVRPAGEWVLYWMIMYRRTRWSFALDRAIEHARELRRPLLVLEALRVGYPWASDRLHRFLLDGFAENRERFARSPILYHPYVEPAPDRGKGLLRALGARACVVVTDDFPAFMFPHMIAAGARQLPVRLEAVDSNGLYPMRATPRVFTTAASFRRHLQKNLPALLDERPRADPLRGLRLPALRALPASIAKRWPPAPEALLRGERGALAKLPIDHGVAPVALSGGGAAALRAWRAFLDERLARYPERSHPDADAASGLSPWLHFGRISAHQLFAELAAREGWSAARLGRATGSRRGFWGMSEQAEAFLDQLVTWRELGFNLCAHRDDYASYDALPPWARATLEAHERDPRPVRHVRAELEEARTGDELWNAAQRQLLEEGRIHNYLRMLWGKRILEWAATPREALRTMIELNDRWAIDGRDPNSYSGICWVLGRYDRAWGPERPIFGKVRYMSSENARRKLRLRGWLARFSGSGTPATRPRA